MSSENLHEPRELLSDEVLDRHRAIVSLMEELEAVDWYDQRAAACVDPELREILEHNRDEEKEHAAMVIEWLRRNDPTFATELKTYLFTDGSILEAEEAATGASGGVDEGAGADGGDMDGDGPDTGGRLDLGDLHGRENT